MKVYVSWFSFHVTSCFHYSQPHYLRVHTNTQRIKEKISDIFFLLVAICISSEYGRELKEDLWLSHIYCTWLQFTLYLTSYTFFFQIRCMHDSPTDLRQEVILPVANAVREFPNRQRETIIFESFVTKTCHTNEYLVYAPDLQ